MLISEFMIPVMANKSRFGWVIKYFDTSYFTGESSPHVLPKFQGDLKRIDGRCRKTRVSKISLFYLNYKGISRNL